MRSMIAVIFNGSAGISESEPMSPIAFPAVILLKKHRRRSYRAAVSMREEKVRPVWMTRPKFGRKCPKRAVFGESEEALRRQSPEGNTALSKWFC